MSVNWLEHLSYCNVGKKAVHSTEGISGNRFYILFAGHIFRCIGTQRYRKGDCVIGMIVSAFSRPNFFAFFREKKKKRWWFKEGMYVCERNS